MKVLIAAGGTGGHIYPGIAVAQEIMRRDANSKVHFVGTARGLETRLVPQAGFELSLIDSAGLKNVSLGARVRGLAILPKSFLSARRLMLAFQPDVVVGAGGYVSGPVVLTAALTNRPTMVMESNALPGWTNRVLARFVDRAAVSFEQALPYFRGKAKVTGNPVRREFFEIPRKRREPGKFSLLVFGGSQGARAINEAMVAALPKLKQLPVELRIKHQTGPADFEKVKAAYEAASWSDVQTGAVNPKVFAMALHAASVAVERGQAETSTLTVIDFSRPSTQRRLWVYDLRSRALLFEEFVSHGRNSGMNLATSFSNIAESNMSSLGLYRTAEAYMGKHGYSLRLDGLDRGFNDRARERAIVIHGAEYVSEQITRAQGRLGRSLGCPAVRPEVSRKLIDAVKGGGLVFAYYPDPNWLRTSPFAS